MTRRLHRVLAAIFTTAGLISCGGGDTSAGGVGEGGTGFSAGTVTGFGSLIVGGVEFDVSHVVYQVDEDPRALRAAVAGDVALGMQVSVAANGQAATSATAAAELIGPVGQVDATAQTLTVVGQTVQVDAAAGAQTVLEGITSLAAIAPGMVLEVHGQRAANGTIDATRIALRRSGTLEVRLAGPIAALDTSNRRFTIGGETVNYAAATVLPPGTGLRNGARAVAFAVNGGTGTTLIADAVRIDEPVPAAPVASIDGFIVSTPPGGLPSGAQFAVAGTPVDASAAQLSGGTGVDLVDGAVVRISGRIVGSVLRADTITVLTSSSDGTIRVNGLVTDFIDATSRFRVHGAPVQLAPGQSAQAAGLANGVAVSISGALGAGAVAPTALQLVAPGDANFVPIVAGTIAGYDAPAGTFTLGPSATPIAIGTATVYVNGGAADLANGRQLVATGTYDAGQARLAAGKITFLDNSASPPVLHLNGLISATALDSAGTTGTLTVEGVAIAVGAQTQYLANGAATSTPGLTVGAPVQITAIATAAGLSAQTVQVDQPVAGTIQIRGFITDLTSPTAFTVAAQPVDASGATFITSGTPVAPANGIYVAIIGTLNGGVLVASQVTLYYASTGATD